MTVTNPGRIGGGGGGGGSVDLSGYQQKTEKGQANGYPSLDSGGHVPSTQIPAVPGEVPTPNIFINVIATPLSNVNWNNKAQSSADYFGGEISSSGAQNAEISFDFYAQSGTYTIDLFHKVGATRGIYTISIDGVSIGTQIDGYAAATAAQQSTIANVNIPSTGKHTIRFLMAGKNASSSSYIGILHGISLTKTA